MTERYRCETMRRKVGARAKKIKDKKLREMFLKCFFSTLDTTVSESEGLPFVFTGDIPAMWLRDSSAQVMHYIPFAEEDKDVAALIRGLCERQFGYILIDPYANAFNAEPNGRGHSGDLCDAYSPWIWERKYELDSLCYPFWLADLYFSATRDKKIYESKYLSAVRAVLAVMETEQRPENSPYRHQRYGEGAHIGDTLINGGRGGVCGYTGMVRTAYRPSDDAAAFGFNIPENMLAAAVLEKIAKGCRILGEEETARRAEKLGAEIRKGIESYGTICENEETFYAYEVDGLGNALFMDDANVPSLLAAPFMGFCPAEDPLYCVTRGKVLSYRNPFYFEGAAANGVGSPHTPDGYIWHIGLCVQLLTSRSEEEVARLFGVLRDTDAGTLQMHEGFDCNDPKNYTRPWFAWANSMFALCITERGEEL